MTRKPYIFYILNSVTGNCIYRDAAGNIQETSILAAGSSIDVSMKNAPGDWMNSTLTYARNSEYFGFNRSYSSTIKLVKDAAYIARTKFYLGSGVQTQLTLVVMKFNSQPQPGEPMYKLYHKAPISFPTKNDKVGEAFNVSLLEGGILQLLKTYERTIFSIPCDGSIPENIKANMDGMYFQDTFNYQILPAVMPNPGINAAPNVIPTVFISNDGDNIGVMHADTQLSGMNDFSNIPAYVQAGQNYIFTAVRPTTIRIQGQVNIVPVDGRTQFGLSYYTDKSTWNGTNYTDAGSLLTPGGNDNYRIDVPGVQTVYFDRTISLDANEKLFIMAFSGDGASLLVRILGGSFTMQFNSIAADTAPWCITAYDLFKLLIKNVCKTASTAFQTFNYTADSTLLANSLNLVCTSGDAVRASGDPNYHKFYNATQTNPNFPNINNTYSYGPVIKTCIADFFQSLNAIKGGALGSQTLPGEGESVFFESKGYVWDSSKDTFDLGEVSDFEVDEDMEKLFTILKVGYQEQQYDQKAGKYEWNTALEMISPINSISSKKLEIISVYRADPYWFERLRANIDTTSQTKNSSDNSVGILNIDRSNSIFDFFETSFTSSVPDPTITNTNLKLLQTRLNQSLPMSVQRAGYFTVNTDPSIIVLSEYPLASSKTLNITINGSLNGSPANMLTGAPADTITLNLFVNGAIVKTWTTTALSPSTPIAITDSLTRVWNTNDNIYVQANTSATGSAQIDSIDLSMTGGTYFDASGFSIPIDSGVSSKMLAFTNISAANFGGVPGIPVISYGFQYFQFNSFLANPEFNTFFSFSGAVNGTATPGIEVDLYVNGVSQSSFQQNPAGAWQTFSGVINFTRSWALGDVMFMLGSTRSNLTTEFQTLDLKVISTSIKAYALKRVQYDYISGIPNLCGFVQTPVVISTLAGPVTIYVNTAQPLTTGPGAPYNIEDLTPKRMLMAQGSYLRSILWDQQDKQLLFSTLSKNQYLVTKLGSVTVAENANVNISDLDPALFTLNLAKFRTRVPLNFNDIMSKSVNAFISWTFNGQLYYGFPEKMTQKSALNEMQEWEALIA